MTDRVTERIWSTSSSEHGGRPRSLRSSRSEGEGCGCTGGVRGVWGMVGVHTECASCAEFSPWCGRHESHTPMRVKVVLIPWIDRVD